MANRPAHEVFRNPVITEKSVLIREKYMHRQHHDDFVKYTIEVDPKATKPEIQAAFEELFEQSRGHIVKINTIIVPGKLKGRVRGQRSYRPGRTPMRKKAIITLAGGVEIPEFEGY